MSPTVYFRALEAEDAELIHKWKNSDELNELTVGLNKKTTFEEDLEWVNAHKRHHPYYAYWAICAKDTGKMIGYACLTDIHYINSSANFSGIIIGDSDYHNGIEWIDSYKLVLEYAFMRLNLNRLYGENILSHQQSTTIGGLMFFKKEGILREACFKNGKYYDVVIGSILKSEYVEHLNNGDFELRNILKRLRSLKK